MPKPLLFFSQTSDFWGSLRAAVTLAAPPPFLTADEASERVFEALADEFFLFPYCIDGDVSANRWSRGQVWQQCTAHMGAARDTAP
ncbi:hypothetical protein ES288_D07G130800v1 [Gossypium darwinii]|uniref:Uncharacterized protein n=1 Tax=Gossypium darwinii TaxID=34276 RepID=A0A5D2BXU6_GOSDA|nr:hypothetical protein ES288_D07G130800v1 [Gossypium darwinii]